jgi:hypothetical protein
MASYGIPRTYNAGVNARFCALCADMDTAGISVISGDTIGDLVRPALSRTLLRLVTCSLAGIVNLGKVAVRVDRSDMPCQNPACCPGLLAVLSARAHTTHMTQTIHMPLHGPSPGLS